MKRRIVPVLLMSFTALAWNIGFWIQPVSAANILIHMETSLAVDDTQICAVPNVAWAAVMAGHKVTILVDASAVTPVTKGFGSSLLSRRRGRGLHGQRTPNRAGCERAEASRLL